MDWSRLQKALTVEAERGFNDVVGSQHCFSEFLNLSLSQPATELPTEVQEKFQQIAQRFTNYSDLTFAQRQHLVAETRRLLHQTKRSLEAEEERSLKIQK
ncbi:MAG: hypothetical protein HC881_21565 [Leptolyngbyaceae cyanobacterium SL_7_1]|nr:hypothetical protein [Leptolyngbyaceae cyanobacterium SL_7_1]